MLDVELLQRLILPSPAQQENTSVFPFHPHNNPLAFKDSDSINKHAWWPPPQRINEGSLGPGTMNPGQSKFYYVSYICTPVTWLVPSHHARPNLNNGDISVLINSVSTQSSSHPKFPFFLFSLGFSICLAHTHPACAAQPSPAENKWFLTWLLYLFLNQISVLINRHRQQQTGLERPEPMCV